MTYGVAGPEFPEGCALIFGGSGGLGSVAARLFADRGSDVVITYRSRAEEAATVIADIRGRGREGLALCCDVEDRRSVDTVMDEAARRIGRVHTVVSSQGRKYSTGPFCDAQPDELRLKFETDVMGFLTICQGALPQLRNGGGSITALVSPAVHRFVSGYGMAVSTKASVASMVKYFAGEEGRHGVRVNAIAPGVINAGMAERLMEGPARQILDRVIATTPLQRAGEAEEIAEALAFLASRRASYITGQIISVDGGFSL